MLTGASELNNILRAKNVEESGAAGDQYAYALPSSTGRRHIHC